MSDAPAPSTMRRDIVSAYGVTAARIASWVIVSSFVYRFIGRDEFATLAFVRATLGVLNYVTLGLAPAMLNGIARARNEPVRVLPQGEELQYAQPQTPTERVLVASASTIALITGAIGFAIVIALAVIMNFASTRMGTSLWIPSGFVVLMGVGTVLRLLSDTPGAVIQMRGQIAADNLLLILAELAWVALIYATPMTHARSLENVGIMFLLASLGLAGARYALAGVGSGLFSFRFASAPAMKQLLSFGVLVTIAQVADYLYAPTDYLLIAAFVRPASAVADYAPAVQIDAGLLLLVSAVGLVLLPKSAVAHAQGDITALRRYYVVGTIISTGVLALSAFALVLVKGPLLQLWFHSPMPGTQAILPLVMIHTVVGGSAMVGRSILLGMGKVKPFTISVLIAGVANVVLSFVFVRFFDLGLRGIVYGTIIAVVARAGVWMPWYVTRVLRDPSGSSQVRSDPAWGDSPVN